MVRSYSLLLTLAALREGGLTCPEFRDEYSRRSGMVGKISTVHARILLHRAFRMGLVIGKYDREETGLKYMHYELTAKGLEMSSQVRDALFANRLKAEEVTV